MNNKQEQIVITDETIVSFYRENDHLDIITMNHILIDILKNLSSDMTKTINTTINSKILSMVSNIDKSISDIDKNMSLLKSDLFVKFYETKKDYVEDLKNILNNNNLSYVDKHNELYISKITSIMNELIPKSQEHSYSQIENCIKNFSSLIKQDTSKLIEITDKIDNTTKDNNLIKTYIDNIDSHLSKMFTSIQQPIFSTIQSSEERTSSGIDKIKETILLNNNIQETLRNEMKDFLNKYKNNSQYKGSIAEIDLQHMLLSIMPSDEIIKVSSDTATCDFKVNRKDPNKSTILFENKYYKNRSTPTEEVRKFERDLQLQKNHGIFISQESPITYKDNFQIDIINGLIHVYIPNANYDVEKIKIAVDIIDNLSLRLNALNKNSDNEIFISKEDVDELAEEYRQFAFQKSQMLETIKLVNKQLTEKLEEIQLPKIKKVLMKLGNIENDNDFKCNYCNNWSGKNKASLGAHIRNCKFNPKNKDTTEDLNSVNSDENTDGKQFQTIENIVLTIPEKQHTNVQQTKRVKNKKG